MNNYCTICNYDISTGSLQDHLHYIRQSIAAGKGSWIVTLNTEMLATSYKEPEYQTLLQSADLIVADGMPLVWASNRKKQCDGITDRTTGVDLVDDLLSQTPVPNFSIIGGVDPQKTLETRFPFALNSCCYLYNEIINMDDKEFNAVVEQFVEQIISNNISIVFLALGVPKQDKLAITLRKHCPNVIYIGIGGTFEILGPDGHRAPHWMQKSGLEWLYRLAKEPKRLWKRYALHYPTGIRMLFKDWAEARKCQT